MIKLFFISDVKRMIEDNKSFQEIQKELDFRDIGQGWGYKSFEAWEVARKNDIYKSSMIVYIPEYCYNEGLFTKQLDVNCCYTYNDFEIIAQSKGLDTNYLFESCDWQHPFSLANEIGEDENDMTETFKNCIYITEPNLNGEFNNMEAYEYLLKSDHKITNEELINILFQACEIERIYSGEIHVRIQTELNDEYYDSDECIFNVDIKLDDKNLSEFIRWDKCPNLPPIYKIDRKISTIDLVEML